MTAKPKHPLYLLPPLRPEARCTHCGERIYYVFELELWLDGENVAGPRGQTPQVHEHRLVCKRRAGAWRAPTIAAGTPTERERERGMALVMKKDLEADEWL